MKSKPKRKDRAVDSERVRAAMAAKRLVPPPTLQNMPVGALVTVVPSQYGRLDVDPRYQRGETPMVNELIAVLNAGGVIADPVSLAERRWGPEHERKKWWIVDGYQRACAFQALNRPFQAMAYETRSLEQERLLFATLNTRYAVSANLTVNSWSGQGAQAIRDVAAQADHPLYDRVALRSNSKNRFGAAQLVTGALVAATGKMSNREVRKNLAVLDQVMARPGQAKVVKDFLWLVGTVFEGEAPRALAMTTLALSLHEHGKVPDEARIKLLRKIKWEQVVETGAVRFRPMVISAIQAVWP